VMDKIKVFSCMAITIKTQSSWLPLETMLMLCRYKLIPSQSCCITSCRIFCCLGRCGMQYRRIGGIIEPILPLDLTSAERQNHSLADGRSLSLVKIEVSARRGTVLTFISNTVSRCWSNWVTVVSHIKIMSFRVYTIAS
jgi:hypothetical protein